jgi:HSP20 family protein
MEIENGALSSFFSFENQVFNPGFVAELLLPTVHVALDDPTQRTNAICARLLHDFCCRFPWAGGPPLFPPRGMSCWDFSESRDVIFITAIGDTLRLRCCDPGYFSFSVCPGARRLNMTQQAQATQLARDAAPTIRAGPLGDQIKQMFDSVARRAFDIFQSTGYSLGHDLGDWLQAERELLHPAHLDVSESGEGFTVRAEVPGFTAKEVEINIEGRRVTISGKRETQKERKDKKTIYSEHCSDQLLRVVDLPADVNTEAARASLKDGVLELELPKPAPAKKIPITSKAA